MEFQKQAIAEKLLRGSHPMPLATTTRRRRFLFGTCLAVSLAIHVTTFIFIILSSSSLSHETVVNYVDLADIAQSPPPSPQVISKPSQLPVPDESEQPPPLDEPSDASGKTNHDSTPSSTQDILSTPLALGMA